MLCGACADQGCDADCAEAAVGQRNAADQRALTLFCVELCLLTDRYHLVAAAWCENPLIPLTT